MAASSSLLTERIMMRTVSQSLPLFANICQEALSRLGCEGRQSSARAVALTAEARELLVVMEKWSHDVPTQEDRSAVISRVLDLNRAVLEHVTAARSKG